VTNSSVSNSPVSHRPRTLSPIEIASALSAVAFSIKMASLEKQTLLELRSNSSNILFDERCAPSPFVQADLSQQGLSAPFNIFKLYAKDRSPNIRDPNVVHVAEAEGSVLEGKGVEDGVKVDEEPKNKMQKSILEEVEEGLKNPIPIKSNSIKEASKQVNERAKALENIGDSNLTGYDENFQEDKEMKEKKTDENDAQEDEDQEKEPNDNEKEDENEDEGEDEDEDLDEDEDEDEDEDDDKNMVAAAAAAGMAAAAKIGKRKKNFVNNEGRKKLKKGIIRGRGREDIKEPTMDEILFDFRD
jgi:hypothetical protein